MASELAAELAVELAPGLGWGESTPGGALKGAQATTSANALTAHSAWSRRLVVFPLVFPHVFPHVFVRVSLGARMSCGVMACERNGRRLEIALKVAWS